MSAHERPSVPEGARRCQGVLASMGAHGRSLATSGDQWRRSSVRAHTSVHASVRPCVPMSAHERPSVPEGARRCQGVLASMGAHGRSLATSGDQWRRSSVRAHSRSQSPGENVRFRIAPDNGHLTVTRTKPQATSHANRNTSRDSPRLSFTCVRSVRSCVLTRTLHHAS